MKTQLDMNKIARGLGAEREGKVSATGGYFGAMQLLTDIEARFRVPVGGGRAADPRWTERRLVPLAPKTLERLETITERVRERSGVSVEPMQLAALLLEKMTEELSGNEDVGINGRYHDLAASGFSHLRPGNLAKSLSVEQQVKPCSIASAARCASGTSRLVIHGC